MLPPMRSQIGRQKLPVNREKVRMLVGEIGYTEAAKPESPETRSINGTIATNGEKFDEKNNSRIDRGN
jgi:hypothetical protein